MPNKRPVAPKKAAAETVERDPLGRAVRVLTWMVDSPHSEWGVREIAADLALPPSSVHRVLALMERSNLVVRNEASGTYRLDLEFLRLSHRATTKMPLPVSATDHLRQLVDQVDETAGIALYDPQRQMMLFHVVIDSSKPLRYVVQTDVWLPVTAGASGLAILAFLAEADRARLLARPLTAFTANTITNPIALEAQLARIRSQGYALSHGQRQPGAVAVAAPIFGADNQVVGDVVLTIPDPRFEPADEARLAEAVLACSGAISADLGAAPVVADGPGGSRAPAR
jgi:DNA-binding IclR family transcriptional regulator